jgi:KRAB domain-containing zinc finger protein
VVQIGGIDCEFCTINGKKRVFTNYRGISRHLQCHKNSQGCSCEICGKPMNVYSKYYYKQHMWTHKNEQEKAEEIAAGVRAPKPIPPYSELAKKRRAKRSKELHLCQQCGKGFITPEGLESHLELHMDPEERDKLKIACPECGKLFRRPTLYGHIRYVHQKVLSVKRFRCTYENCPKSFPSACRLDLHIRRAHTKEGQFVCEICGRACFTKYEHSNHLRSHSDRRDFACKFCPEAFKHHRNLVRHEKVTHKNLISSEGN